MLELERRFAFRREDGQSIVEYGMLIATGALAVVVAMLFLAGSVDHLFRSGGAGPGIFKPPVAACDPSYEGACVPPGPPYLTCGDLTALGVPLPVTVVGSDPHGLDPDGDGLGCNGT
jgi:Flp pilus assembly pilin Flp